MLFEQMTNFYKDYAYEPHHFKMLMQAYEELFRDIYDLADQYIDNTSFADSETYRIIPYQAARIDNAAYDIKELLSHQTMVEEFGMADISVSERVSRWNDDMGVREKIDILDRTGHFIQLTTFRDGIPSRRSYEIINFDLYNDKSSRLIRNVDYAFFNNRIYLLGETSRYASGRSLVMRNVAIDFRTPEFLMGKAVKVDTKPFLTQNEYREIVQAFVYAALGGPTVKNLNESLGAVFNGYKSLIIDKRYAEVNDLFYKAMWDEQKPNSLGRFDFLMLAPAEAVFFETQKTQMVRDFINLIKPSYASMSIAPYIDFEDIFPTKFLNHIVGFLGTPHFRDQLAGDSFIGTLTTSPVFDSIYRTLPPVKYDDSYFYDTQQSVYDTGNVTFPRDLLYMGGSFDLVDRLGVRKSLLYDNDHLYDAVTSGFDTEDFDSAIDKVWFGGDFTLAKDKIIGVDDPKVIIHIPGFDHATSVHTEQAAIFDDAVLFDNYSTGFDEAGKIGDNDGIPTVFHDSVEVFLIPNL